MVSRLSAFALSLWLAALACNPPAAPATQPTSARLEDLRAQIDALPAGQRSFDLWVPDELTSGGAPIRSDMAMAVLVDGLLARGLFPAGYSAGTGGRTYHYSASPPK
jgi:hypothetical protein